MKAWIGYAHPKEGSFCEAVRLAVEELRRRGKGDGTILPSRVAGDRKRG